jgi:ATP-dependent RNA helicase DDX1
MSGGWDGIGLAPELVEAVTDLGWQFPVDVQDEAIPLILGGGDVMVAAATGSGKTGAFGLPIVQTILEQRRYENRPAPKVDYDSLGGDGGAVGAAAAAAAPVTLSRADCDSIVAVADDGLGCRTEHPRFWGGVRATKSVKGGKYYFEVTVVRGLCRVGFSTADATLDLGTDAGGFGYGGTAMKSNMKRFDPYGEKCVRACCACMRA